MEFIRSFYFAVFAAFVFGYFVGYGKGKARGQVEGINFAEQRENNRRMSENMARMMGGHNE